MARPRKKGLDYFPFDVDFFNDEKIIAIAGEFGLKGEITVVKLLCAIYRAGYYVEWNEVMKYKLVRELQGVSVELLQQIVERLVKWKFFEESLFNSDAILTSRGIQSRYFDAVARRKKKDSDLPFLLVSADINPINANINSINVDINPQSKVNKSKEKEIKNFSQKNDARDSLDSFFEFLKSLPPEEIAELAEVAGVEPCNFMPLAEITVREWRVTRRKLPTDESDFLSHLVNVVRRKAADNRKPPESAEAKLARSRRQRRAEKEQAETARAEAEKNISKGAQGWAELIRSKGLPPDTSPTDYYRLSDSKH